MLALIAASESAQYSVTELAARTLLRDEVIECLENDDWDALPAMIYVHLFDDVESCL